MKNYLVLPRRQRKIWQRGLRQVELDRRRYRLQYPWHLTDYRATERVEWYSYLASVTHLVAESLAEYYPKYCIVRRIHGKALQQRIMGVRMMREQRLTHQATWPKIV